MKKEELQTNLEAARKRVMASTGMNDEMIAALAAFSAVGEAIVDELKQMNQHLEYLSVKD